MGVLNKLKNMFTEEIEDEEPTQTVKKEVIKVEIPSPKPTIDYSEVLEPADTKPAPEPEIESPKEEEKFKFPVFFDDKDFSDLKPEKPKKEEKKREKENYGSYNPPKESKKIFKPTPIISPVYGILDKNYSKEDIKPKPPVSTYYNPKDITIDEVRKKAYGTLEEDLESTLFDQEPIIFEEDSTTIRTEPFETDIFDEIEANDDLLDLKDEKNKVEELTDSTEDAVTDLIEAEMDKNAETIEDKSTNDKELFNLIDSMYEDKK